MSGLLRVGTGTPSCKESVHLHSPRGLQSVTQIETCCTNLIRSVIHELGVSRDLVDVALQVATLDIGSLEAPVEGLTLGLVVADEVELLGGGGRLGVVGRGLDLLPGCLGAVRVEGAHV